MAAPTRQCERQTGKKMLRWCASFRCLTSSTGSAARREKCPQSVAPSGFVASTAGTSIKKPRTTKFAASISFLVSTLTAPHVRTLFSCASSAHVGVGSVPLLIFCLRSVLACQLTTKIEINDADGAFMYEPLRIYGDGFGLCDGRLKATVRDVQVCGDQCCA